MNLISNKAKRWSTVFTLLVALVFLMQSAFAQRDGKISGFKDEERRGPGFRGGRVNEGPGGFKGNRKRRSRGPRRGGFGKDAVMSDLMIEYLGITETQLADIQAFKRASAEQSRPIHEEIKSNNRALRAAMSAGDMVQIDTLAAQLGQLQGQLIAIGSKARVEIGNVLTAEQKDKKKQLGEKRRSRMKSRREQLREGLRKRFEKGANNN